MMDQATSSVNFRANIDDITDVDDKNNNNFRKRKSGHHMESVETRYETEMNNRIQGNVANMKQQHAKGDTETSKNSTNLNFSVDRILETSTGGPNQTWNKNNDIRMSSVVASIQANEEFNRLYRPMPVRYLPNAANFSGLPLPSAYGMPLQRTLLKQPYLNYHHIQSPATQATPNNFYMDKILATSTTIPYSHLQNPFQRTDIDPTNPKITSIPPPTPSNLTAHLPAKRKRSWSRAVFSQLQRKGLEIQFQIQKYITKPDRRKLAARLGLTDAQVKVWFQNRRMKWRHSRDTKSDKTRSAKVRSTDSTNDNVDRMHSESSTDDEISCSSDEANSEIDVVAE